MCILGVSHIFIIGRCAFEGDSALEQFDVETASAMESLGHTIFLDVTLEHLGFVCLARKFCTCVRRMAIERVLLRTHADDLLMIDQSVI